VTPVPMSATADTEKWAPRGMTAYFQDARRPSRASGLLLGIGLGGFVDGIVLHQLLQWHHMVSDTGRFPTDTIAGLEANTVADGLFHLLAWFFVLGGSIVTVAQWRQGRLAPSWSFHLGGLVAGWGLFNLVEGVVDHLILDVHHVRDDLGGPLSWDIGFLVLGALLIVTGLLLQKRGAEKLRARRTPA
jgi:uncharacterized membrane protein